MTAVQHPATRAPLVGAWLCAICVLVAAMILVGGATRLTDSGLSITEWDFAKHFVPPLTEQGWAAEFALYRATTEYQVQNRGMTTEEFQFIYLWEWGHRFLGQVIGVVFAVPFAFFLATGRLKGRLVPILVLGALGGLQGAVGWWMVTSGLYGRLDVSAVRLMVHLGLAFLILGLAFWLMLDALAGPRRRGVPGGLAVLLGVALYAQILLGALVAGSDAGRAFADWPTVGGEWIPSNYGDYTPFSANLTENLAAVQFHHRMAGYAVAALALGAAVLVRGAWGWAVGAGALAQAALGVATVILGAPLWISLVHQAGAVFLWLAAIALIRGSMLPHLETVGAQGQTAAV